jgi:hypothetical protein
LKEFLKAREKGTQIAKQFLVNLYKDENWGEFVSFHHDTEIEGIRYKNLEVRKRPDGCMHFSEGADHIAENIYGIDTHEPVYFELRYQLKTYKPKKENRTYRMTTKPSRLFASESKYYAMDDSTLFRTVKLFAPQQYNNFCAKMARIKRNPPANFGFASQNNLDLIEKWKNAQLEEGKKYWIELMNKRGPWAGETSYVSLSAASSEDLKTFEMLKKGDYQGREIAITKIAQKMDNDEVSTAESILLSCK